MPSRRILLKLLPITKYDKHKDVLVPVLEAPDAGGTQIPATFSYKENLYNLLSIVVEGKKNKIADVVKKEELKLKIIGTPALGEFVASDDEWNLLKKVIEDLELENSIPQLRQLYLDIIEAPRWEAPKAPIVSAKVEAEYAEPEVLYHDEPAAPTYLKK